MNKDNLNIFGIRHHGPGSARSLRQALENLKPDIILIEGPSDASRVIELAAHKDIELPIALLLYTPDDLQQTVFYPFAEFSPEWQAIQYGLTKGISLHFMDLPQTHLFALKTNSEEVIEEGNLKEGNLEEAVSEENLLPLNVEGVQENNLRVFEDPLGQLAKAAGYSDGERWWDEMVESRQDSTDLFLAIQEAMVALREEFNQSVKTTDSSVKKLPSHDYHYIESLREAYMRKTIRKTQKAGYEKIAVVCGAWHVPALLNIPKVKEDNALLKGLPKSKVAVTWVPWTYGRLAQNSGYGAGINSPGWYHHLWHYPNDASTHWLALAARLFREENLDASSAHVIEGVRLAETLAAVRNKPMPGLEELNEAIQAIFCFGNSTPMKLIEDKLIINDRLGKVSDKIPKVPLQEDLERLQKSLRFKPEAFEKTLELDLRKELHLKRSHLLHRLNLLDIPWGIQEKVSGKRGSFHENWLIKWQPEFAVSLIEASIWGNSVYSATSNYVINQASKAEDLADLTKLLNHTLLANVPKAVSKLMENLQNKAALTNNLNHLLVALPPLVQVLRYGNVRKTDAGMVTEVIDGLVPRICIGLSNACTSLDDEAATEMYKHIVSVHSSIYLLENKEHQTMWCNALEQMVELSSAHGLVLGRATRLLQEVRHFSSQKSARVLSLALSRANEPTQAANWIEGFLKDSGILLLHDYVFFEVIDDWVTSLDGDDFTALVPLLRRTFSTFSATERRQLGEKVKSGKQELKEEVEFDEARAEAMIPVIKQLLGI